MTDADRRTWRRAALLVGAGLVVGGAVDVLLLALGQRPALALAGPPLALAGWAGFLSLISAAMASAEQSRIPLRGLERDRRRLIVRAVLGIGRSAPRLSADERARALAHARAVPTSVAFSLAQSLALDAAVLGTLAFIEVDPSDGLAFTLRVVAVGLIAASVAIAVPWGIVRMRGARRYEEREHRASSDFDRPPE